MRSARSELDVVPELQREVQELRLRQATAAAAIACSRKSLEGAVPNKEILAVLQADLLKPDETKPPPKDPDETKDPKEPKEPKPACRAPPKRARRKSRPRKSPRQLGRQDQGQGKGHRLWTWLLRSSP